MRWLGYGVVVHGYESFALDLYLRGRCRREDPV